MQGHRFRLRAKQTDPGMNRTCLIARPGEELLSPGVKRRGCLRVEHPRQTIGFREQLLGVVKVGNPALRR